MNKTLKEKNKNTFVSINELCDIIDISKATAKNWIKLNKLKPDLIENNQEFFFKTSINNLLEALKSKDSSLLKTRRNKKFISGSFLYKDYVSENSENLEIVQKLLNEIFNKELFLTEKEIKLLLADCVIKLLFSKNNTIFEINNNNLLSFLNSDINLFEFNPLINDLIDNKDKAKTFILQNADLFNFNYIYEENEDILGLLYISLSNLGDRKARGAYFTPTKIVEKIIKKLSLGNSYKIIDPCCGTGNFLLQLPKTINYEQIFGNDIDTTSIILTRINMALKFNIKNIDILYKNFTNNNFLTENTNIKYTHIIGNPPWGYNFTKTEIEELKNTYLTAKIKNVDSFDIFIEQSLKSLKPDGTLSFVLPEALLNVKNHQIIRQIILENSSIKYLEFLGNMFDKVQCPSIILQLKYTQKQLNTIGAEIKDKKQSFTIKTKRNITSDIFGFSMNDEEYKIFKTISNNKNKVFLKNNAVFALGIVTGNNKDYLSNQKSSENEIILKGSDILKYRKKEANNYIKFHPKSFQQVAPTEYYRAKEKILYRFICNKPVFAYDKEQTLSLNSCNIIIPTIRNIDIKYILAILNSRIVQFIFQKQYNSVKILRSHIEQIPIPNVSYDIQNPIIEKVNLLLHQTDKKIIIKLYEEIDCLISKLYELKEEDYKYLKDIMSNEEMFLF